MSRLSLSLSFESQSGKIFEDDVVVLVSITSGRISEKKFSIFLCLFKRVLDRGPEQRESKLTVLCLLIIKVLIS